MYRGLSLFLLLSLIVVVPVRADSPYGRFHALVIGNQNYKYLKQLKTPIADAEAVAEVLDKQYGFEVELLLDTTWEQAMEAVSALRSTANREDDNLLIYYAGHGYLNEKTGVEYWQPVDSKRDNDIYWIPTSRITSMLKEIQAKHVLVVADSCYSGSLLMRDSGAKLPDETGLDELLRRMQIRRSRTALTSGGEEPVWDSGGGNHSIFAKAFLDVLRENRKILDGYTIFDEIRRPVALNAPQTPQYGDIRMTGHEWGDFLLVPKALQTSSPVIAQAEEGERDSFAKRGEMPQKDRRIGQYIDHGDGTITDTKIGLMWKRCSEGLFGDNCEDGEIEKYNWNDAMQRFKNVEYAGYADWRLPTIDELKTLVHCSKGKNKKGDWCNDGSEKPTINRQAFPNSEVSYHVWSGSPHADYSGNAWFVYFYYGYSDFSSRNGSSAVRLVRDGQ